MTKQSYYCKGFCCSQVANSSGFCQGHEQRALTEPEEAKNHFKTSEEELIEILKTINKNNGPQEAHLEGEALLMTFLKTKGYSDVAEAYQKASSDWWYV